MINLENDAIGRTKIKIPLTKQQVTSTNIKKYLPKILAVFYDNYRVSHKWYEYYKGKQPILNKDRGKDNRYSEINNKVLNNYAFECVEFKKGYMFGDPVKYVTKVSDDSSQIDVLNTYMIHQNKATLNRDLAEQYYITGTGYLMCTPSLSENIDLNLEAPFQLHILNYSNTFVVYSSSISEEKILAGYISQINNTKNDKLLYEIIIYTDTEQLIFYAGCSNFNQTTFELKDIELIEINKNAIGLIPIVEYPLNNARQGIIEICVGIDIAINTTLSNNLDDLQQYVNDILVIYNANIEEEQLVNLKKHKVMILPSQDINSPTKVEYVSKNLNYSQVQIMLDDLVNIQYDKRGVPKASGNVTSGGDTTGARLLGGGWTRANVNTNNDILSFEKADRELLNIAINICKAYKKCPIYNLKSSEIEIIFNINRTDNLNAKVDALTKLISIDVPKEMALNIVGLVSDSKENSIVWEKYVKSKNQEDIVKNQGILNVKNETLNTQSDTIQE